MLSILQETKKIVNQIVENHLYNLTLTSEEVLLFNNSLNDLNEKCNHWHKIEQITLDVTELRRNKLYIQVRTSFLIRVQNMKSFINFTTLCSDCIYSQIFQVYVNYINLVINLFIPTLVLGVLNCLVYRSLKNSTTIGNQLRRSGRGEEAMRKRDIRLTRIAIAIVGVFIACHLPRFIPNIVEMVTSMPQVKT